MSDDKAAEARESLLDSVTGKAKEVAGAVTGKDDLVEEGQLQQAEARERKSALADEAIAEARQAEAVDELSEANRVAAERERVARTHAEQEKAAAERQQHDGHVVADLAADQQEAAGRAAAQREAEEIAESRLNDAEALEIDATLTEEHAASEKRRLQAEATAAEQQAAQLRATTEN